MRWLGWLLLLAFFTSSSNAEDPPGQPRRLSSKSSLHGHQADTQRLDRETSQILARDANSLRPTPRKSGEDTNLPFLSPGAEYTEEMEQPTDPKLVEMYNKALRFLQRGRPQGVEARKAAYRLLDQAKEAGHLPSKKLMGFAHLFGDNARWSLEEAKKLFTELAEDTGSADAQFGLAFMHATGLGMDKSDPARAFIYYNFAALGGNPLAKMALGYRYLNGIGVNEDCEEALRLYKSVAEMVVSDYKHGTGQATQRIRLVEEMSTPKTSSLATDKDIVDYYRFLADQNDLASMVSLGQIYMTGSRGVEQDYDQAFRYLTDAADLGSASAYAQLGKMYLDGTHVTPQDNATAFHFFLKSTDKNNIMGQIGLGIMYLQGRGVTKNPEVALRLFKGAADQASAEAQFYLGYMFHKGLGVKRNLNEAFKYYQLAAQGGNILAMYNLGVYSMIGLNTLRSCPNAVDFFKNVAERGRWAEVHHKAFREYMLGEPDEAALKYLFMAELGYEAGQSNFAYILDKDEAKSLFHGESRYQTYERAAQSWRRAANQMSVHARLRLGDYYYYGFGTEVDYERAFYHYKIAYEKHSSGQAMYNYGYMHAHGLGVPQDFHLAKRYYDEAGIQAPDAIAAVYLQLAMLGLQFGFSYINQNSLIVHLDEEYPFWEVWALGAIVAICTYIAHFFLQWEMRRRNRLLQQAQQRPAQNREHF
ncbi:unnamed protein product, partial [Mesorhabditis spiculigera]